MTMKTPILLLNYKTYKESLVRGVEIAKICKRVSKKLKVNIVVAPQYALIKEIVNIIPTFSQDFDPMEFGSHTGSVLGVGVKRLGVKGSLINHSEKRLPKREIEKRVRACKRLKLISVLCSKNLKESENLARLKPDFIAIEPPELIGGKVSVSTAKPSLIKNTVDAVRKVSPKTKVLCGAGIHTSEDVRISLKLGAKGVLVASGIIKASNIEKALKEIASGFTF